MEGRFSLERLQWWCEGVLAVLRATFSPGWEIVQLVGLQTLDIN